MNKRRTASINEERVRKLDKLAINTTVKTGKIINWTDIVNHLIDNYADEASKDIVHRSNLEKN